MKFGVREICDVVLKAKSTQKIGSQTFVAGQPVIYFDTAKTSSMESAATTVYAQGGKGNSRLIAWEGEKTVTFTFEDALISMKGLAILSGADLLVAGETANTVVTAHVTEQVPVATDGKIAVEKTISANEAAEIYVILLDNAGEMSGVPVKATGEGKEVTCDLVKAGDIVMVDYYTDYAEDAQQIDITPDKFAGYYYLEASTLFRRQSDGVDLPAEFIIPKVKIQSNFTFTLASTGDPSSFTFTMDAVPDYTKFNKTKKVLAAIQVLGADDNFDGTSVDEEGTITYSRYTYDKDTKGSYLGSKAHTANDTTSTNE